MSDRDKKLLVYLGALIILADAYFLVAKPFLDKVDQLASEKNQLQAELSQKREAYENKGTYEQGIADSNNRIQEIIDEFPEDNTDEKSIMFVSNSEKEIPEWVSQIKFAEVTENSVSTESASDSEAQAAQEAVEAVEGESMSESSPEVNSSSEMDTEEGSGTIRDLITRNTEIGLNFAVKYDGFKKWLAYVRDYEDRIVIKDIEVSYDQGTDIVSGSMVLSQYALIGPGRELPPTETGVEDIGKENVFVINGSRHTMIELIGEVATDLIESIIGGLTGNISNDEENYFINVTAATDNTNAKTVGRAKDPSGTTYLTSNTNDKESVQFTLKGEDGRYWCEYELGGYKVSDDEFRKDITGKVVLRIISTARSDKNDKSAISLHLHNTSDIPLIVNVENDDEQSPRIDIADTEGDVTVNN